MYFVLAQCFVVFPRERANWVCIATWTGRRGTVLERKTGIRRVRQSRRAVRAKQTQKRSILKIKATANSLVQEIAMVVNGIDGTSVFQEPHHLNHPRQTFQVKGLAQAFKNQIALQMEESRSS